MYAQGDSGHTTLNSKAKRAKKYPTSINLSAATVTELKRLAAKRGVPYQTLMRMFVLEGLARLNNAA